VRALGFEEHGDISNLKLVDLPLPEPGPGEVRVRLRYAALNRLDLFVLKGWKNLELPKPHVGGSDGAGEVDKLGLGVTGWTLGERVVLYASLSCGACQFCTRGEISLCAKHHLIGEHKRGTFAESICVPAANLKRVPDGFPFQEAVAASLAYLTAWRMLITRADLKAGESVLVVGAAGGVNTAAIEIAKLAGAAPIIAVGTSDEKLVIARAHGADHLLLADSLWEKEVARITGKRGADVVVDNVGEVTWSKSIRACARGGRIVTVGGTTGYNPSAELNQIFWKQLSVIGSTMGTRAEFDRVMDLVFSKRLHPTVDSEHPLAEGPEAYRRLASGQARGKVLVRLP
jgi:NADPH2:quinone reductase